MENISFEDFSKLDIRTGTVLTVEAVAKSKKLLKLTVSFGGEVGTRTIMAGIAQSGVYGEVKDGVWVDSCLIGQSVLAIVNLAPRSLMGVESHGMLLASHNEEDKIYLANCRGVPDGSKVG